MKVLELEVEEVVDVYYVVLEVEDKQFIIFIYFNFLKDFQYFHFYQNLILKMLNLKKKIIKIIIKENILFNFL
jgi:hypothetical protein